jgi:hypothetical protein
LNPITVHSVPTRLREVRLYCVTSCLDLRFTHDTSVALQGVKCAEQRVKTVTIVRIAFEPKQQALDVVQRLRHLSEELLRKGYKLTVQSNISTNK